MNYLRYLTAAALGLFVVTTLLLVPQPGYAKSLYVNADLNGNSPIRAYDIQAPPNYLIYQATSNTTGYGGVGLAIDTDSETLFVTFEFSGSLKIVDAKTLVVPPVSVVAPNATNLAGIVVDQDLQKVYTVDRATNHLYVYSWDAVTKTLTNDYTSYVSLPDVYHAYGLALDEVNDILYVGDQTTAVKKFSTADWSSAGSVTTSQTAIGVAIDVENQFLYTGGSWFGSGYLVKTDLATDIETSADIRSLPGGPSDNVMGVAVDPLTNMVYVTTGYGSDRIIVYDSDLNWLHYTGDIGNPTGIVVPGKEISYNPLNLSKDDGLADDDCVVPGAALTYTICYDNVANPNPVENVVVGDQLPPEVSFQSASDSGVYDSGVHKVTWSLGTLPAGDPGACVSIDVLTSSTLVAESVFTNSVSIVSDQTPMTTVNESSLVCANSPPVADANGPYDGVEGTPVEFDGSGSWDADGDLLTFAWDYGDGDYGTGVSPSHTYADNDNYAVGLTVDDGSLTDGHGTTAIIANAAPDLGALGGPTDPVAVNVLITVVGAFTDPGTADTHTAVCDWGDTWTTAATVVQGEGFGSISAEHSYGEPGVYSIVCTVTDDDGASDSSIFEYAVIYDPDGGFVTGGGWIWSAPGAYVADDTLEGRANFGFVSKYKKGAQAPTGSTEFQFHAADLNFHSSSYDWLVIAHARAIYKGVGTINGAGNFGFMISAIDEKLTPSTDVDLFRMKIWDKDNGDAVVYDNQLGDATNSDPTTALGGGSIVIHKK